MASSFCAIAITPASYLPAWRAGPGMSWSLAAVLSAVKLPQSVVALAWRSPWLNVARPHWVVRLEPPLVRSWRSACGTMGSICVQERWSQPWRASRATAWVALNSLTAVHSRLMWPSSRWEPYAMLNGYARPISPSMSGGLCAITIAVRLIVEGKWSRMFLSPEMSHAGLIRCMPLTINSWPLSTGEMPSSRRK